MTAVAVPGKVMELLSLLRRQGVELQLEGERLRVRAPKGALPPELRESLAARRDEIVSFLQQVRAAAPGEEETSGKPRISPVRRDGYLPLSFAQERLWFLERLAPGSPVYHVPLLLRLSGVLRPGLVERVLGEVVRRHEALRTAFSEVEGKPVQVIFPPSPFLLPRVDLSAAEPGALEEALRIAAEEVRWPFDLARGPLLRALLLRLGCTEHLLVFTLHHIVSDGWSLSVLAREVGALYAAFEAREPSPLAPLEVQYADFAVWQRTWLEGGELERQLVYWRRQLAGAPVVLELPLDRPRPPVPAWSGRSRRVHLPPSLARRIEALAVQAGATPYMVLLAAFAALLGRAASQDDIPVGSPIAGRCQPETEGLIGFFVNTLVLRLPLGEATSFRRMVERARQVALEAYNHQDVPFEQLVAELRPGAWTQGHNPLFQALLALQNFPVESLDLPGLRCTVLEVETGTAKLDLSLLLQEEEGEIRGSLVYSTDLFDDTTAERLAKHFVRLVDSLTEAPGRSWREASFFSEAELHQLRVEWGRAAPALPPDTGGFLGAFERHAARAADAPAARRGDEMWTYGELDSLAERLAAVLCTHGVGRESRVGLHIPLCPLLLAGILGTFKAGGAFVPLPPGDPEERLRLLVEDAGIEWIVEVDGAPELPPSLRGRSVRLSRDLPAPSGVRARPATPQEGELAYVIYTSGSTGLPKGVMIEHRSLSHYLSWVNATLLDDPSLRIPAITRLSFDASLKQLLAPMQVGREVWIAAADATIGADALWAEIGGAEGVALNCVPSLWSVLLESMETSLGRTASGLRRLLLGGEAFSPALLRRSLEAAPGVEVWNLYGPSEATANATAARVQPGGPVILGRPIAGVQAYVLDRDLHPVGLGHPGELVLGGIGLARGYLGRPDLTAERFVPHPFAASGGGGERLYRTGDLVRFLPTGDLEFRGRIDHQVKVRGYRVELGEIEAVLQSLPGIREAAVRPVAAGGGDLHLIAWVVAPERPPESSVREALRKRLPEPMIPAGFVWLDEMPRLPTGKIDRQALLLPSVLPETAVDRENQAPRTATELRLVQIWEELLGARPIGIDQSFFELGGHSLLAVRLVARIEREFGARVPLPRLLALPTIEHLAAELDSRASARPLSPLLKMQAAAGPSLPFFCVHPIGGSVFCYLDLMRSLGREQPFFGLQSVLNDAEEPSLEETAAQYLEAVRRARPQAPYALGGWSMGGVVAFEMARQLEACGEEVALLALLDSGAPGGGFTADPGDEKELEARFLRDLAGLGMNGSNLGAGQARDLFAVFRTNLRMLQRYELGTYGGSLLYFRSAETLGENEADPTRGWRDRARGSAEVQIVPGDHYSMLRKPRVGAVARRLAVSLARGAST